MADDRIFETLTPSWFYEFTIPNTLDHRCYLLNPSIRVAELDSPTALAVDSLPKVVVMIVPEQRETDWIFCTESGHLQLLFDHGVSRLILIGNELPPNPYPCNYSFLSAPDTVDMKKLEEELEPLVISFHPTVCFQNGLPKPQFLTYEDDLLYRVVIGRFAGPVVGEFVVEDVLLENYDDDVDTKLRRRLRSKRFPNLVQSQVLLWPKIDGEAVITELNLENVKELKNTKFDIDTTLLVHPYLTPMVSGLFLIASHLNERFQQGFTPRALCLGIGGGSLLTFLNTGLGFEVVGVEADLAVLSVAKQYFGFNKGKSIKLVVGDAIDLIENSATKGDEDDSDSEVIIDGLDGKYDVVMVDLYSSDTRNGICAPPLQFVKKSVIHGAKLLLHDHGVLIMNVASPNEEFYEKLVRELKDAFYKVFETEVEEEDNRVLMATVSPPISANDYDFDFMEKLRSVIPGG